MSSYSIKDLEHLSGVKAHTIRIWEQRYTLFSPQRTDTNIRYYSDQDLKLLLNVALLKDNGFKISRIAHMPHDEITKEVAGLVDQFGENEQISALTVAMVDMDQDQFEQIISRNVRERGFKDTMIKVVYPFLNRIGVLWVTGSIVPAQEHFISNLIRQKIIAAIDGEFGKVQPDASKFVLFLPEGELHEMSLLFADYLIKSAGGRSIYLGQSVPTEDLITVCDIHSPDYILTILTSSISATDIQGLLDELSSMINGATLLITGYQVLSSTLQLPANVKVLKSFDGLEQFL